MLTPREACYTVLPGDMLACSGNGTISDLIRVVSPNHTHVAVIASSRPAVVAESTAGSTIPDMESQQIEIGVQAHFLSDWLMAYDGSVWLFRLNADAHLSGARQEALAAWIETEHRAKVGYNFAGVMRLGAERVLQALAEPRFGSLFCSQMLCEAYQEISLLPSTINPADVTPDDCCSWPLFDAPVQLK